MKQFFKRAAAIAAAAVMTMGVLSGCGSKDDKLTLGTNAAFPPFEFTTTNGVVGNYDGIDICIGKEIVGSMNKELQVEDMEFDGLIAAVKSQKKDNRALIFQIHITQLHRLLLLKPTTLI